MRRLMLFDMLACLALTEVAKAWPWSATRRMAFVRVLNNTTEPIVRVQVQHKYSNVYKNDRQWNIIQPGQSSDTLLPVDYETGFFTIGRDWWIVSWLNQDRTRVSVSSPDNLRVAFDALDDLVPSKDSQVESTVGFKQHILREQDAGRVTDIVINPGQDDNILFRSLSGDSSTSSHSSPGPGTESKDRRPFWAIAHRVLDARGVQAALDHGANALEIDVAADHDGWWAWHKAFPEGSGKVSSMATLLKAVADARTAGKPVGWIWFDLKNPDTCAANTSSCSIEALRDMARASLQPAGVKVLYGFMGEHAGARAYRVIRQGLNDNEALGIDGQDGRTSPEAAKAMLQRQGPAQTAQHVWTTGLALPSITQGSCEDAAVSATSRKICPQIRYAIQSKAFGRVFAWTIAKGDTRVANELMYAGVDGLIYGHVVTDYADSRDAVASLEIILRWLETNKDRRYLATAEDEPW